MKFSIIIPAYNAEKKIENTLRSIESQIFNDFEVIVINDASTDNTAQIVSKYKKVQLINNKINIKAGGARNVGLDNAKGDYIVFLDADDIFVNCTALQKINNNIEKNKYPDLVYLGFETSLKKMIPCEDNSTKNRRIEDWKYANVWDVCWNREFLEQNNIRFIENRYFEDFPFYYEGVIKSNTYSYIDEPIVRYTIEQNDSMTRNLDIDKIKDFYENMNLLLTIYQQIESPELRCSFEKGALFRQHENIAYYMKNMLGINIDYL